MPSILIIGATRGLGASLANLYAEDPSNTVFGTTRSSSAPASQSSNKNIIWLKDIDVSQEHIGTRLVDQLGDVVDGKTKQLDIVFISAGYFATEDFHSGPKWEEEVKMYTTSAISPPFIIRSLVGKEYLRKGSKVVLISSESGSITLRHEKEGGGNYGHHASKAALNMVGKLLSFDLKNEEVIVSIVHPGFMRTEMTKGVGFDKYWDDGGAVTPDEAAKSLRDWAKRLDMSKTGEYWAPRGPGDIGTAEPVLGTNLSTPLHLPW